MKSNEDSIAVIKDIKTNNTTSTPSVPTKSNDTTSTPSVPTMSTMSTQIDSSTKAHRKKKSRQTESDEWFSSVTCIYADSIKSNPTVDSASLINVYWDIYKVTFKDLILEGTDTDALKDVSFYFKVLHIIRIYHNIAGFCSAL